MVRRAWGPFRRWELALLAASVGLVGMNYHFVGDVIAGGFIGGIVGTYTGYGCGLGGESRSVRHVAAPSGFSSQRATRENVVA